MALGSTQPLTEMSKGRPARNADNLTAICEPTTLEPVRDTNSIHLIALHYFFCQGSTHDLFQDLSRIPEGYILASHYPPLAMQTEALFKS
jgi:hypothetical protein